ncbi:hypothetical protein J7363_04670 [Phaeobacter italicus]|uniref:hypothetical protein n=1 Tax=Phaeobacter italicus TaxID=481446 RepID=UPI001ADC5475|nr:hypothetical protein [Phaeobacter italicus]MBO9441374.1 hypothetical protein [Phaeobacter italicus]
MDASSEFPFWAIWAGVFLANALSAVFAYGSFFYTWHEKRGTEGTPSATKYLAMMAMPMLISAGLWVTALKGVGPDFLRSPIALNLAAVMAAHMFCFIFGFGVFNIVRRRRLGKEDGDSVFIDWMMVAFPIAILCASVSMTIAGGD